MMKLGLQRRLDRIIGTIICRLFSILSSMGKISSAMSRPERILVILLSEMGSLVLAKSMFDRIREKYPEASVHVLVFEQNREVLEIMEVVPSGHILTVGNRSLVGFLRDSLRVFMKFRLLKFNTVVDCELFSRISSIYSFLSGADIRAGFHPHTQEGLYRGSFINRPVLYNPYIHISTQFVNLIEALESDRTPRVKSAITDPPAEAPVMRIGTPDILESLKRLKSDFPHIRGKKLVFLNPGGGLLPIRAWPLEYYCRVAEDLVGRGYAVAVTGMERDRLLARRIISCCGALNCMDLTGYTESIRELMVLFHFGALLIANDGGPGHFATMTPIHAIVIYGPETPRLYAPLGPRVESLYSPVACSPCLTAYNHRNSPCDGDNVCLRNILPEEVLRRAYDILEDQEGAGPLYAVKES